MNRRGVASSVVLCAIVFISGCVTPEIIEPPSQSLAERTRQLEALTEYQVNGGLGVWTDDESLSARIQWLEKPDELSVQISGPLGMGNLLLVSRPGFAVLSRAGNEIASGPSVDRVLQQGLRLTAPMPMQQLQQWVRGLPGNAKSVVRDTQGKLSSLRFTDEQGVHWQARFLRYADLDGLAVPALITASGGPFSVRLVLKDWQRDTTTVVPEQTQSDGRLAIPDR